MMAATKIERGPKRSRVQAIDKHIGARIRERRTMLGLTQAHKYENGTNRIAAGRLFTIAQALGVEVSYLFQGVDAEETSRTTSQQRMVLDLARNFINMPSKRHQEAICALARIMADPELDEDSTSSL